ncbi:hypothetical protein vseg_017049 [Gypsophila vaccaria]
MKTSAVKLVASIVLTLFFLLTLVSTEVVLQSMSRPFKSQKGVASVRKMLIFEERDEQYKRFEFPDLEFSGGERRVMHTVSRRGPVPVPPSPKPNTNRTPNPPCC